MIYLDNAATTRACQAAAEAAVVCMREGYYNPSAAYGPALEAEMAMRAVREQLCRLAGAAGFGVTFTGGGTESAWLALTAARALVRTRPAVVVSAIEHPAVAQGARALQALGHEVRTAPVDGQGLVDEQALRALVDEKVALVCVMHVSNEFGTVQRLADIARIAHDRGALLFSDGVQGFVRCPVSLARDGVDLYGVSGHKLHAPKGTGALFARPGVRLLPVLPGGGQEGGLRSGTHGTPGIAALGAALGAALWDTERLRRMKAALWEGISERAPWALANGAPPQSPDASPHILSVSFPGVRGEVLLHALEADGLLVSTGSACSSHHKGIPAVAALGVRGPRLEGTLRLSLGMENTMAEMDLAAALIAKHASGLRA